MEELGIIVFFCVFLLVFWGIYWVNNRPRPMDFEEWMERGKPDPYRNNDYGW